MKSIKKEQFFSLLRNIAISAGAVFLVVAGVYAATTIGTNINTTGTLDVTGLSTLDRATSTSATTTAYLYVGRDITEPTGWDFLQGDLIVSDDAFINSQATTSVSLWVGSGGTATNINLAGGDLYVQDGLEVDGGAYLNNATTTDTLYVSGYASTSKYIVIGTGLGALVPSAGDLFVSNKTTSTAALWVGSGGTATNINLAGGDLYVQNDAEIDGSLWVVSATTTDSVKIGGYASTSGDLIVNGGTISNTTSTATSTIGLSQDAHQNSTSTVSVGKRAGDQGDKVTGCLEMVTSAGTYVRAIIDGTVWNIQLGRCND